MDRRVGRFVLQSSLLEVCPDVFKEILSTCIVVRCEQIDHMDVFEYIAICDEFQELGEGCAAPEYHVVLEQADVIEEDETIGQTAVFSGWTRVDAP